MYEDYTCICIQYVPAILFEVRQCYLEIHILLNLKVYAKSYTLQGYLNITSEVIYQTKYWNFKYHITFENFVWKTTVILTFSNSFQNFPSVISNK